MSAFKDISNLFTSIRHHVGRVTSFSWEDGSVSLSVFGIKAEDVVSKSCAVFSLCAGEVLCSLVSRKKRKPFERGKKNAQTAYILPFLSKRLFESGADVLYCREIENGQMILFQCDSLLLEKVLGVISDALFQFRSIGIKKLFIDNCAGFSSIRVHFSVDGETDLLPFLYENSDIFGGQK